LGVKSPAVSRGSICFETEKVFESAEYDKIIKKGCVSRDLSLMWRYSIFYAILVGEMISLKDAP